MGQTVKGRPEWAKSGRPRSFKRNYIIEGTDHGRGGQKRKGKTLQ